jgi:hypothetical protein
VTIIAVLIGIIFFIIAIILGYQWIDAVIFLIGLLTSPPFSSSSHSFFQAALWPMCRREFWQLSPFASH